MLREQFRHHESSPEMSDFHRLLRDMAVEEGLPDNVISEDDFALAAEILEENHRVHGDPKQSTYKYFHNGHHPVDFIRRFWKIWKIGCETLPHLFDEDGYRLGMLVGAAHERIKTTEATAPGVDEVRSASWAKQKMLAAQASYSLADAFRVGSGIVATTAIKEGNSITQPMLRKGNRDLLKLTSALADTSGVFMEGVPRLVDDVLNIHLEQKRVPVADPLNHCDPAEVAISFQDENEFILGRIEAFRDDLRLYVPDEDDRRRLREAFEQFASTSDSSRSAAQFFVNFPDLTREIIETSIQKAGQTTEKGLGQIVAVKEFMVEQFNKAIHKQ